MIVYMSWQFACSQHNICTVSLHVFCTWLVQTTSALKYLVFWTKLHTMYCSYLYGITLPWPPRLKYGNVLNSFAISSFYHVRYQRVYWNVFLHNIRRCSALNSMWEILCSTTEFIHNLCWMTLLNVIAQETTGIMEYFTHVANQYVSVLQKHHQSWLWK